MILTDELVEEIRECLGEHMFSSDGEYNNEDVIEICEKLDKEIKEFKETHIICNPGRRKDDPNTS